MAIVVLGVAVTWYSRYQRLTPTNYGTTPPLAPIPGDTESDPVKREGDKWYEAVGFYTCDKYAANINVSTNPYGISTSNDGVIHIAPFERKYAGHNATLGLFAKAVGLDLDRNSFKLPGDNTTYKSGTQCNGKDGQFVLKEWTNASDNNTGKEVKSDPTTLLLEDNHALTIAWVPTGMDVKDIPLPASASGLAAAKAADAAGTTGTTPTTVAGETTTTVAGETTTTAAGETTTTAAK